MLNYNHDVSKGLAWRKQKNKTFPTFPARKTNEQKNKHNYVLWNFKNKNKNNLSKTSHLWVILHHDNMLMHINSVLGIKQTYSTIL